MQITSDASLLEKSTDQLCIEPHLVETVARPHDTLQKKPL